MAKSNQSASLGDILNGLKSKKVEGTPEERLKAQIDHLYDAASSVREERTPRYRDSYRYFLGARPLPMAGGYKAFDYVEPVLYEAVQRLTPSLLNIFTENESKAVAFRAGGFNPDHFVEAAVNKTINRIFLRENDGYKVLEDAFKEAMITGDSFIKYFIEPTYLKDKLDTGEKWITAVDLVRMVGDWDFEIPNPFYKTTSKKSNQDKEFDYSDFSSLKPNGKVYKWKGLEWKIDNLADNGVIDQTSGEVQINTKPMMYIKGVIQLNRTVKELIVEQVDLKDLVFNDNCGPNFEKCRYISHRRVITVGEGIAAGYDKDKLLAAATATNLSDDPLDKKNILVDYMNPSFTTTNDFEDGNTDEMEREIELFEDYLFSSVIDGKTKQWEVIRTKNDILEMKEVSRHPFAHFIYENIPGSFWGRSLYDVCKKPQDELSHFARMVAADAENNVRGRYQAKKNGYDRQSLLNNRPGAVIEVAEMGNVVRFEESPMSGVAQSYYTLVQQAKDRLIASSTDSIITQDGAPGNLAASTVQMMINQAEMRDKTAAKCLARSGLVPLFRGIYEIMREEGYVIVNADGSTITSDQLPSVYDFVIDISTTNDDAIQGQQMTSIMNQMVQMQSALGGVVSTEGLYNYGMDLGEIVDVDMTRYLSNPADAQNPQAQEDERIAKDVQKQTAQLNLQLLDSQLEESAQRIMNYTIERDEMIKNGEATRTREAEKSLRDFDESKAKVAKLYSESQSGPINASTQNMAVATEQATGKNITGVRTPKA